jgi:ABC-type dipeptide/oligopeptide/nickel transport system permease component
MAAFIIRRIVWTIPVLLLVILMIFVMMRQIEGNPFQKTNRPVPPQVQENLERKFNLDKPPWMQYLLYVKGVFTLDLGPSLYATDRDVMDIIKEHFPRSVKLGVLAFMWAIIFGIPAGIIAALRPNSLYDYLLMLFSSLGFALPSFFVATLFIYYFAVKWHLVPVQGWPLGFWDIDSRVILPSLALGLFPMAYFARLVRGTMLETMQQDYVRTARAKGLRWRSIVVRHVFRNSLIPVVTATAPLFGLIITGTFVIEVIFSIPGIGRYFVASVSNRDYAVVMGITVLTSVIIILANLFVDLAYGFLDPRTRTSRT